MWLYVGLSEVSELSLQTEIHKTEVSTYRQNRTACWLAWFTHSLVHCYTIYTVPPLPYLHSPSDSLWHYKYVWLGKEQFTSQYRKQAYIYTCTLSIVFICPPPLYLHFSLDIVLMRLLLVGFLVVFFFLLFEPILRSSLWWLQVTCYRNLHHHHRHQCYSSE